jgi:hypothetical protein
MSLSGYAANVLKDDLINSHREGLELTQAELFQLRTDLRRFAYLTIRQLHPKETKENVQAYVNEAFDR